MKKIGLLFCLLAVIFKVQAQDSKMNSFINDLMSKMTVEEKIGQLNLTTAGAFVTGATANSQVQEKLKSGQIGGMLNGFSISSMRASQELRLRNRQIIFQYFLGWMLYMDTKQYFLFLWL